MSKKIIISFISGFLLLAALQFYPIYKKHRDSKAIQDYVNSLVQQGVLLNESLKVSDAFIDNGKIEFHFDITSKFEQLTTEIQYAYLDYLAKNIRYKLRDSKITSNTYQYLDMIFLCKSQTKTYEYKNVLLSKSQPVFSEGTLYLNNEQIYTAPQFKAFIQQAEPLDKPTSFEKEVFDYAVNLFKQLTVGGKYYNYDRDSKVIVDIVTKKFGISYKQYSEIYQKQFITGYSHLYKD
ncbi:hypothetical protein [Bacillus massiliigorillae]|uniref:hypothetical protein n=1 Tax=Bacillus massiliigorillae TaxID=1243664 RepID=UPI00039995F6|nr:hypothetical protein [Bacillus massiliigorillae]